MSGKTLNGFWRREPRSTLRAGLFGKLPGHADFLLRRFPSGWMKEWDQWLATMLSQTEAQFGDGEHANWRAQFLACRPWRCAVVDCDAAWTGIMQPSQDSVGRLYPLLLAVSVPAATDVLALAREEGCWYAGLEMIAAEARAMQLSLRELDAAVATAGRPISRLATALPNTRQSYWWRGRNAPARYQGYPGWRSFCDMFALDKPSNE